MSKYHDLDADIYPAYLISNYFIHKMLNYGYEPSRTKLIKMVYFAHGWFMALNKRRLIIERIQIGEYGPVINELYDIYKNIVDCDSFYKPDNGRMFPDDEYVIQFLDRVWDVYSKYNPEQLSSIAHEQGSPYDVVTRHNSQESYNVNGVYYDIIPNSLIQQYFENK